MSNTPLSAQQIAEKVRDVMFADDAASKGLGMQIEAIGPGLATIKMVVQANMLNGHGTCHGGFITTLADSAFAFACNSYNEATVASGLSIDFVAPAKLNDTLTAYATEVALSGRTGVYDIAVKNQSGVLDATMRAKSYSLKGRTVFPV